MRYYDFNAIYQESKNKKCDNIMIAGGKGNGKTYGALRKGLEIYLGLENPAYKGYIIRYARRHKESVRQTNIKNLLRPHCKWLETVTDGKYNSFMVKSNRIYLAYAKDDKIIRKDLRECLIANALSTWENDSGTDEGEAGIIVFDEAISREMALKDEFSSLMKYHNNCRRNRHDYFCPLVLLGNTVTRDCELFEEMGVDLWNIKDEQKGHIQYVYNRKGELNCIFEWCGQSENQESAKDYYNRFMNNKTKMITDGAFTIGQYKTLQDEPRNTETVLNVLLVGKRNVTAKYMYFRNTGDIIIYITDEPQEKHDIIINPNAVACNDIIRNYFGGRFADVFKERYASGNIIFNKSTTGEIYRAFALKCIGLKNCVPD